MAKEDWKIIHSNGANEFIYSNGKHHIGITSEIVQGEKGLERHWKATHLETKNDLGVGRSRGIAIGQAVDNLEGTMKKSNQGYTVEGLTNRLGKRGFLRYLKANHDADGSVGIHGHMEPQEAMDKVASALGKTPQDILNYAAKKPVEELDRHADFTFSTMKSEGVVKKGMRPEEDIRSDLRAARIKVSSIDDPEEVKKIHAHIGSLQAELKPYNEERRAKIADRKLNPQYYDGQGNWRDPMAKKSEDDSDLMKAEDPRYTAKVKWAKWNIKPDLFSLNSESDQRKYIKQQFPEMSKEDHIKTAEKYSQKASALGEIHQKAIAAAQKEHGVDDTNYMSRFISGGGHPDFHPAISESISNMGRKVSRLKTIASAHGSAARYFNVKKSETTMDAIKEAVIKALVQKAQKWLRKGEAETVVVDTGIDKAASELNKAEPKEWNDWEEVKKSEPSALDRWDPSPFVPSDLRGKTSLKKARILDSKTGWRDRKEGEDTPDHEYDKEHGWGSVDAIQRANERLGRNWFSPDTMKFFNSKIDPVVHHGKYFVSSEKGPSGVRKYSVREATPMGEIKTVGEFGEHASMRHAYAAIKKLGKK